MSLPTNSAKAAQSSIRSFFQPKAPKYAPPPSQAPLQATPAVESTETNGSAPEPAAVPSPEEPASTVTAPLPSDLPREANIRPITSADINALRRINSLLLQVPYSDTFYDRAADEGGEGRFSRVITWTHDGEQPQVVGGVVCRVEPVSAGSQTRSLYIQSLCLLSPYRSLGLITAAINIIAQAAEAEPELNVKFISAHVWTENEEGLQWYDRRGFKRETNPVKGYYIKLRPDSAWFVQRDLTAIPVSSSANSQRSVEASTTAAVVNLPPMGGPPRPDMAGRTASGQSYQNRRAETEWNDLPADMANGLVPPPRRGGSGTTSGQSSRSSSTARKKRDRSYPAAAFGS